MNIELKSAIAFLRVFKRTRNMSSMSFTIPACGFVRKYLFNGRPFPTVFFVDVIFISFLSTNEVVATLTSGCLRSAPSSISLERAPLLLNR